MSLQQLTAPVTERIDFTSRFHGPKPEKCYLKFSDQWRFDWCSGKFFEITQSILVPYSVSYILPESDYKDLNLSNESGALNLYPTRNYEVNEMLVGFRPGLYLTHIYIPQNQYVLSLAASGMYPDVTDTDKRYLGAQHWTQSPYWDPTLKLWDIYDMNPWYLRPYVLQGANFEKVTIELWVKRHRLKEVGEQPNFTTIPTPDEIRF